MTFPWDNVDTYSQKSSSLNTFFVLNFLAWSSTLAKFICFWCSDLFNIILGYTYPDILYSWANLKETFNFKATKNRVKTFLAAKWVDYKHLLKSCALRLAFFHYLHCDSTLKFHLKHLCFVYGPLRK